MSEFTLSLFVNFFDSVSAFFPFRQGEKEVCASFATTFSQSDETA